MSDGAILFPFTGSRVGGSHMSTFHLAHALGAFQSRRAVIIAPAGSSIIAEARRMGLETREVAEAPATRRATGFARVPAHAAILQSYGADALVHCSDLWTLQAWGLPAKLLGRPLIYHHRTIERQSLPNRALIAMADLVICISDACRENLRFLPAEKVTQIMNPFPPAHAIDAVAARAEFAARWPIEGLQLVGFAANFQARKRPMFFLDVAAHVAASAPSARFVMFGAERDVKPDALIARANELSLADRFMLAGFRTPPELNLAPLDVLIAPALAEPFGRTLVEALMVGTPYVATDDAGHHEIHARWGGGRVTPRAATSEQVAEEALAVLAARDATRLNTEARAALAEELSPRMHAKRVLDVYARLKQRRRP